MCRPKQVGPLLWQVIYGHSDNWKPIFEPGQKDTAANLRRQKQRIQRIGGIVGLLKETQQHGLMIGKKT